MDCDIVNNESEVSAGTLASLKFSPCNVIEYLQRRNSHKLLVELSSYREYSTQVQDVRGDIHGAPGKLPSNHTVVPAAFA